MPVHEAAGRQLNGEAVRVQRLGEAALVVVVAERGVVVRPANVDDDVQGGQDGRVTRTHDLGLVVLGQLAEHPHAHRLVGLR